jgi:hypothetical protein
MTQVNDKCHIHIGLAIVITVVDSFSEALRQLRTNQDMVGLEIMIPIS